MTYNFIKFYSVQCSMSNYHLKYHTYFLLVSFMLFMRSKAEGSWLFLFGQTNNEYTWTDKWRVRYTNWGTDEPKLKSACVYMDVDGYWKTSYCNESFYFLCKKSDGNWIYKKGLGNLKFSGINYSASLLTLLPIMYLGLLRIKWKVPST